MKTDTTQTSLADLMKQHTLQTVVHDLRSPMTVIKGNLQLLLSGYMGQMSAEQIKLIERSVGPLDDLILMTENLLQMVQLENDDIVLNLEQVDLDQILGEIIDFYQVAFQQRGMSIYREGNTLGQKLKLDAFWFRRVLHNLIWNAYKFTPDNGTVALHVRREDQELALWICDTGRGIPADRLEAIFNKFEQVETLRDRRIGTGLGLWICKRIMHLHGGRIRVESQLGQGSRFILSFPSHLLA